MRYIVLDLWGFRSFCYFLVIIFAMVCTHDFTYRFLVLFYSLFITGIDDIFVSQNANVFIEYDISTKSE